MNTKLIQRTVLALLVGGAGAGFAQGMPTSQPGLLTIFRESVKLGRNAEHARFEAGWPAAYQRAKSPYYYLAMVSLTGPNEAWFVAPYASNTAIADAMRMEDSDTVLAAELKRLARGDAEFLTDARVIQLRARSDLSLGQFPNLATQRFWEITTFRVRPGHEAEFDAAAKAYGASALRAAPGTSYRVYQVMAGGLEPTFVVFSSVTAYAEFDQTAAAGAKTMQGMTPEENATLTKFFSDGLINSETNRFRLDPGMSYVSAETRSQDPAFWMPKPAARRP